MDGLERDWLSDVQCHEPINNIKTLIQYWGFETYTKIQGERKGSHYVFKDGRTAEKLEYYEMGKIRRAKFSNSLRITQNIYEIFVRIDDASSYVKKEICL